MELSRICLAAFGLLPACLPDLGTPVADGSGAGDPVEMSALAAEGEVVFFTAEVPPHGNVGCQFCHCPEAMGGCRELAPNIVGKSRDTIAYALQVSTIMAPLDLTEHEIDAVAAYLAYLARSE